ncbi:hypothetical protein SELMODRAFT_420263 [Selaginella moellendorffii]|uniref:Uncharacterized protein n=1 Tax=Selaginella moellendorffii TaxID=88036 RepID=D8SBF9_SELML|nr:hypothetical protein SELMODRAFT_420263 [Selaginella moellendorffii]
MGISNEFAIEGKVTESQGWYCLLLQQACSDAQLLACSSSRSEALCLAGGLAIGHQAENDMRGADLILPEGMTCCVVSLKTRGGVSSELTKWKEQAVADTKSWLLWDQEEDKSDLQLTCYGLDGNFGYPSREVRGLLKNILVTRPDPLKGAGSRVDQANAAVSVRGRLRRVSGGRHECMLMDYSVSRRS